MARIHTLAEHEAHKIAAGEVVERPVSVVKELLENALDAEADNIQLIIHDGGRSRIQIIDNGHGMDHEDMYACIKEHATSKITSCSELSHIASFGFRGEALSSISTVSKVTITSQEPDAYEGYTINVQDGKVTNEQMTARSPGTEIIVDDLFYNVPARKKFLKKRETEWRAIYQLCVAFALARPHCAITVTHDDRRILQCPYAESYMQRISQMYDAYFAKQFIPCESAEDSSNISVSGVITHPEYHRYDRSMLTCFVNNRWVKNHRLAQAVIKGYADILPPRRFPAGYIFLSVPAEEVDINVHPRKEEVQFLHPRRVERAIEQAVRSTLEEHVRSQVTPQQATAYSPETKRNAAHAQTSANTSPLPARAAMHSTAFTSSTSHTEQQQYPTHHVLQTSPAPSSSTPVSGPTLQEDVQNMHEDVDNTTSQTGNKHQPVPSTYTQQHIPKAKDTHEESATQASNYQILGQILHTYIIIENADGCVMIDQHAAHERILYEAFSQQTTITTTRLVFPHRVTLSQADCDHIMSHAAQLQSYGLELDRFDPTNIVITAVPVALKTIDWSDMLNTLVGILPSADVSEENDAAQHLYHDLCATMACKAAIKAGDPLSHAEMLELVNKLDACPHRMTCPHGRPTTITFSQSNLERKFKRIT